MELQTMKIGNLTLDPNNARKHSKHNLDVIAASLKKFGQRKPIVVHNGTVIAGNGTLEAAKSLGWTEIEIALCPEDWDSTTAKAYALADNRSAELAEWDNEILLRSLLEINEAGLLAASGYVENELKTLVKENEDNLSNEENRGDLLSLLNVAYGEPAHIVVKGEVYEVGKHILVIADVLKDWKQYISYLKDDLLFLPYPGPYVALSAKLDKTPSVLVQPNEYLAGHLLDKYASVHGESEIKKVKSND